MRIFVSKILLFSILIFILNACDSNNLTNSDQANNPYPNKHATTQPISQQNSTISTHTPQSHPASSFATNPESASQNSNYTTLQSHLQPSTLTFTHQSNMQATPTSHNVLDFLMLQSPRLQSTSTQTKVLSQPTPRQLPPR